MADDRKDRCPGCGKHCSLKSPGCGYGRRYAQKQPQSSAPGWTGRVTDGGTLWQLLTVSRSIRHGLKDGSVTEQGLTALLTPAEQDTLTALLKRFNAGIPGR